MSFHDDERSGLFVWRRRNQYSRLGLVFIWGGPVNISASDASIQFHAGPKLWDIVDMLSLGSVNISASDFRLSVLLLR